MPATETKADEKRWLWCSGTALRCPPRPLTCAGTRSSLGNSSRRSPRQPRGVSQTPMTRRGMRRCRPTTPTRKVRLPQPQPQPNICILYPAGVMKSVVPQGALAGVSLNQVAVLQTTRITPGSHPSLQPPTPAVPSDGGPRPACATPSRISRRQGPGSGGIGRWRGRRLRDLSTRP